MWGKCKIIYKGSEYELCAFFKDVIEQNIHDYLAIKLKGISKVTDCINIFFGWVSLYSLPDIKNWDTRNITDMTSMFSYCRSLNPFPDISGWGTKKVKCFKNFFVIVEKLNIYQISLNGILVVHKIYLICLIGVYH